MLNYCIDSTDELSFGENFLFLLKLAVKSLPKQKKDDYIYMDTIDYTYFGITETDISSQIVYLSEDDELCKYIRLNSKGSYFFGVRMNVMKFIKTFLAKEKTQRVFSVNKYLYGHIMKNSFKNTNYSNNEYHFFESRYVEHRKRFDDLILLEKDRSVRLFKTMKSFMENEMNNEKALYNLIKMFLKIRKII